MQKIKHILPIAAFFAALVIISGCKNTGVTYTQSEARKSSGESWSVFVYMCGGTADEETVYSALDGMMDANYTENIKFAVELGGKNEWSRDGLYGDYTQRFLMQDGSMYLANQSAGSDMCTDEELTDFLEWGVETYPAEHYALVIWGEGSGLKGGVGVDERYDYDSLSVEEIYYSLAQSDEHFDFVGFDASYMSNLETAASIAPYADYMVATEETIAPNGWDYKRLAEYLIENPDAAAADVGADICAGYYEKCGDRADVAQMAVTDLSHATEILQQFDGMMAMMEMSADSFDYLANLMRKMDYVESCGAKSDYENYTDMVDLGNLAAAVQSDIGSAADSITDILNEAVVYNVRGDKRPNMKGIAVYYPFSGASESIEHYCDVFRSRNCLNFARKISPNAPTALGPGEEDYNSTNAYADYVIRRGSFALTASVDGDGYRLSVDTDPQAIKEVGLNIYSYDADTGKYLKLGTKYDGIDGETGVSTTFETLFPTKCLSINGHNVMSVRIEKGDARDIYSIPVLLNGSKANIRVAHNLSEDKYEILGVWSGVDASSGMDSRDYRDLKKGDKITPLFDVYGQSEQAEGKTFKIGMTGAKAEMKKIKKQAVYEYCVVDMYSNVYTADLYAK